VHLWLAPKYSWDPPSSLLPWWQMGCISRCCLWCIHFHHKRYMVSCFAWTNSCPSITFFFDHLLISWNCVICWWHLHLGWCGHYQFHSSRFGFMCCFISQGGHDSGGLGKGRTLSWSTFDGCISSPCHRGFWLLMLTSRWILSSMC
jgi:hypothetical protein